MLATGEEGQTNSTVITGVLIMIPQAIHILVSTLAITYATSIWTQLPLGFLLNLP